MKSKKYYFDFEDATYSECINKKLTISYEYVSCIWQSSDIKSEHISKNIECRDIPDKYIHYGKTKFDTGLAVHMLQEYVYVPLVIFREILHNRGIKSELDAWLTFLCEDAPEMIELLIWQYPHFRELYNDVYKLCGNIEDIMGCFSEALQEMDRNTVQYMIEEQQAQIEEQKGQLEEQQEQLKEKDRQLEEKKRQIEEL